MHLMKELTWQPFLDMHKAKMETIAHKIKNRPVVQRFQSNDGQILAWCVKSTSSTNSDIVESTQAKEPVRHYYLQKGSIVKTQRTKWQGEKPLLCSKPCLLQDHIFFHKQWQKDWARRAPVRGQKQSANTRGIMCLYDLIFVFFASQSPEPRVCTSHKCCMQMIWLCWLMSPVICKSCWAGWPCTPGKISICQYFQVRGCALHSAGENVPVFDVGSATLHHKDSCRYLGMVFYRTLNMAKSAEHASRTFLASAYRIRRFVREHALADRPHTSLWLVKTYVIPAGMYGSQVWGTVFCRQAGSPLARCLRFIFWRAR
jgi:hypothetical protein